MGWGAEKGRLAGGWERQKEVGRDYRGLQGGVKGNSGAGGN